MSILRDRYHIEKQIGCGLSGKVYLAKHIKLNAKRVIKCVSKQEAMYEQFLTEATILKNLNHPGIPIIYDLEEDEEYLYIIEEYIEGESLKAILLNHKIISRDSAIHFTIQICNIIEYLHNIKPYPVLYLDLKPDHIIVCNNSVKIIDFGAAIYMEKEEVDYSFGTPSFAAPEQFSSLKLDSKADIYAIGSILYFMLTGKSLSLFNRKKLPQKEFFNISNDLKKIILKCMEKNPQHRYENVSSLKKDLSICKNKKRTLIIAIAGSQPRIGVTHVAISMVSYLNRHGIKALYEEKNDNSIIPNFIHSKKEIGQKEGVYYFKNFEAIPNYNETICIDKGKYEVIVRDCGNYQDLNNEFGEVDMQFILLGTKAWELNYAKECFGLIGNKNTQYLFNLCDKKYAYEAAKLLGISRAYRIPMILDPFRHSKDSDRVFNHMLKDVIQLKRRTFFKK